MRDVAAVRQRGGRVLCRCVGVCARARGRRRGVGGQRVATSVPPRSPLRARAGRERYVSKIHYFILVVSVQSLDIYTERIQLTAADWPSRAARPRAGCHAARRVVFHGFFRGPTLLSAGRRAPNAVRRIYVIARGRSHHGHTSE